MTTGVVDLDLIADLIKAAGAPGHTGEEPERWAIPIHDEFVATGNAARRDLASDAARFAAFLGGDPEGEQASLRALVRQHHVCRIGPEADTAFWAVPRVLLADWRRRGVAGPRTKARALDSCLGDMAEAARLGELLDRDADYARMKAEARKIGSTEMADLAARIARETLVLAIENMAARAGNAVGEVVALSRRQDLIAQIARMQASRTARHRTERLIADLGTLFGAEDPGGEWRRAAVTTTRYALNLGRLTKYRDDGTRWIAYTVQPTACDECVRLLLLKDRERTPRAFPIETIWRSILDTGGLNVGRKAKLPPHRGGWVVGALIHPHCFCVPRPAKAGEIDRTLMLEGE